MPIVLNIIEDTKKSATIRSAEMYVHGIEINIINEQLNKKELQDGQYNIIEFTDIEINGEKPSNGMIEIEEGKIVDYSLQIGKYIVNYDKKQKKPVISGILRKVRYEDTTGAKVDIVEGLTPVVYKNNNWEVADISEEWYDYSNQEWANAVILNTGVTKNIGDTVDVASEVKGMLVYVPRYEYKIEGQYGKNGISAEQPGEIEVNFITKKETKPSEGYRVHPGFTFGSEELNGIWVGKFETTGTGENPTILPSVTSLRNQNVSTMFETSQKFNSYITDGDSHMAKNSEWGAIAYLSQSKYGKYGNSNYSETEKEVMINDCVNFITGVGADSQNSSSSTTTCETNTYETVKGQAASTTGNITGIYDMSGGSWELVMAILLDPEGKPRSGYTSSVNSGYTGMLGDGTIYNGKEWPDDKYYDKYVSLDPTSSSGILSKTACSGGVCYGHALSETIYWYGNYGSFANSNTPWIGRGGRYIQGANCSIFYLNDGNGSTSNIDSFRIVISNT